MRTVLLSWCVSLAMTGCGGWGGGSDWIKEPLVPEEERAPMPSPNSSAPPGQPAARTIGAEPTRKDTRPEGTAGGGRVLGTFRNTYYDFPNESDYGGAPVSLMNSACQPIAKVPRGFYEAVCVQGSGSLARGGTVSFAKRDCACAEICPRTNQHICFDALDKATFPWGRGAAGSPITPLRTIAADTQVLPMGTVLYIPELDGASRGGRQPSDGTTPAESGAIDGCFVVEDRGLRVQGEHVDIFTGHPSQTAALNAQVPSNRGVTVIVESPKCAHLAKR